MTTRQVYGLIALGAAGATIYRATKGVQHAADAYRRRGPRWDVILLGALAVGSLLAALGEGEAALRRVRRVF